MGWQRSGAVSAAVAAGLMGVALLPPYMQAAWALDRWGVAAGHFWLLWSGHVVHFGWPHVAVDAVVLAVLLMWLPKTESLVTALGALLCAPLLSIAILWAQPGLQQYRGASGMVVWLAAVLWVQAWQLRTVGRRWLVAVALVGLAKLAWEAGPGAQQGSASLPSQVQLAWSAHAYGALLGAAWALLMWLRKVRGR
jgi:hypothetical protein